MQNTLPAIDKTFGAKKALANHSELVAIIGARNVCVEFKRLFI
jgi:hypothetical protein